MSASHLNSPPINISIHSDDRFPASPWKDYDTDWKFPTESDMDNHNSNQYTPSYGSFNSIGSRSPSWGGRENGDPMNLYEEEDMFLDDMSSHSNRRHQNEYDPSHYDGNIVGDMDGIPSVPFQTHGGLDAPPATNHYSPVSNDGSPASSRSRASSTSSMYHSAPSPPKTVYIASLTNSHMPLGATKAQSPPALVIPEDAHRQVQQNQHQSSQRGGLQSQDAMSINIVPSTPIGGLGDPKDHAFPQTSNPNTAQTSWQTHSRDSSTDLPFSFTQHRSPALSAASSLHNSPLPPSMSLPNVGMNVNVGGMGSTTPLLPPHSLHNSPLLHPGSIPGPSSSPIPSASPAALSLQNSPLHQASYNDSARNSPIPTGSSLGLTHNRTTSDDFLLPDSAAHQRPRASSWGEHNAPGIGIGVTSTSSGGGGGGGGGSLGLSLLNGPSSRNAYTQDAPSSSFGGISSINDLLQPPRSSVLGLGLPPGANIRRAKSDAGGGGGGAHRKIKSEDLRDFYGGSSGGGGFRDLSMPSPSLGLANVPVHPSGMSQSGSLSPAPGRSPLLGHRVSSSLSIPIGHTVGSSHRSSHSIGSSAGFHSQRSSPYPSPHASPSLRVTSLSNDIDNFGYNMNSGMNYPGGLLNVPGTYGGGGGGGGGGSNGSGSNPNSMGLSLAPPLMSTPSAMGMGIANLTISGNQGMSHSGPGGGGDSNNSYADGTLNPPKKLVTTKATHEASTARRKNDAAYLCPVPGCGSTFTRSFNLKGHLRSHNEERPFKCKWPGCEKGFARQHDCKRHEALHLNIRPYTCTGCKKTFARMDALNRHLRSEGGAECLGHDPSANFSPSVTNSASPQGLPYPEDKELKFDPDYGPPLRPSRSANGTHNGGRNNDDRGDGGLMGRGRLSSGQQTPGQSQELDGLIM